MPAGALDRRITLQAISASTDDGMRVVPGGWDNLCDVFAGLSPLSGGEKIAAGEVAAFQMQKFRVRKPKAFTVGAGQNRIVYAGTTYDITEVQEVGRDSLDLIATARADEQ